MNALIIRVFILAAIVFVPVISLIYGYKKLRQEDFVHTGKVMLGATIVFLLLTFVALTEAS